VTRRCDWRIHDLLEGKTATTLYLVVPPSDISRTKPLVRLIHNQIGRRLTEELDARRRRHRLLLMLDEFPTLGRLDFFESALAFMAGYGLKSFLIAQSRNQIEKAYRPTRVHAAAIWDANGVDRTVGAILEFPGGLLAQVSCSFAIAFHRHATIAGENGLIETTYLNHPPEGGPLVLVIKRGTTIDDRFETIEVEGGNGVRAEAESFARLVAKSPNAWSGATPAESVDIMLTLDAMVKSVRSGVWEEVGS
jgi:hypothetical protein